MLAEVGGTAAASSSGAAAPARGRSEAAKRRRLDWQFETLHKVTSTRHVSPALGHLHFELQPQDAPCRQCLWHAPACCIVQHVKGLCACPDPNAAGQCGQDVWARPAAGGRHHSLAALLLVSQGQGQVLCCPPACPANPAVEMMLHVFACRLTCLWHASLSCHGPGHGA